jgi:hypothetical protein
MKFVRLLKSLRKTVEQFHSDQTVLTTTLHKSTHTFLILSQHNFGRHLPRLPGDGESSVMALSPNQARKGH